MKQTTMPFPKREIPKLARIKQSLRSDHIDNPRDDVRQKLIAAGLAKKIFPGAHVAITAGSRGIGGFVDLVSGIADAIRSAGGKPFIIPAMGSHGGATPAGQVELLRRLGITEKSLQAPVRATMDTLELGHSKTGAAAHLDKFAAVADGIIVLGGVKAHPENKTGIASGLLKMTTVGLGKQVGAQQAHSHGLWDSVKAVPRLTLARSKVLFGVGMVENAYRQPSIIEVVPASYDAFRSLDERLLKASVPYAASIPFEKLDLLVVDKHGKDISGTGMDLNVIGKWRLEGGPRKPDFLRIVALSLTKASLGNGLGVGLADFTTTRFMKEYDPASTYVNLLTSTEPGAMNTKEGPLPLALPSDREAIGVALWSTLAGSKPRICRIQSTKDLGELWVSEALLPETRSNSKLSVLEKPKRLPFDSKGNLF
jgi:hypothetical protein